MAVTKTIEVDGKEVQFRASAAIPRLYRNKFHRDIYKDLNELQKRSSSRRSPSLPSTSQWNSSPASQLKLKHKKSKHHRLI